MKIQNPGNALVVYRSKLEQMKYSGACSHIPFGYLTEKNQVPPLQMEFDVDFLINSLVLVSEKDNTEQPLTGAVKYSSADGKFYLTYLGELIAACGFYSIRIRIDLNTLGGGGATNLVEYWTEVLHFQDIDFSQDQYYELEIGHSDDTQHVAYKLGYKQKLLFTGYEDFSKITTDVLGTIDTKSKIITQRIHTKIDRQINILFFPQYWIDVFAKLAPLDQVRLTNKRTGNTEVITESTFSSRPQSDGCFLVGTLSYLESVDTFSSHDDRNIIL